MATSKTLQLILELKDDATKKLKGFGGAIKNNSQAIKNAGKQMTVMGGAITGIAVLAGSAAAQLEATEAKYNTVFSGMTDVSDAFIADFKKLTPATEAEARSMASGIQDLLVPMGFMREEATALTGDTMHLVGALTNFNSATHTAEDVQNAMAAALTGSYESLKRLGIQVNKETIQEKAFEMGLADANGEITKQAEAQALVALATEQSSDALAAYNEESLDTKTKMMLLKAQMVDTAAKIGAAFLPMVNQLIDKIKPLVEKLTAWIEANPELAGKIAMVVAGIGGLMLVLGPFLMILPGIVTAIGLVSKAFALLAANPIVLLIAALVALVAIFTWMIVNWDKTQAIMVAAFEGFMEFIGIIWEGIKNIFTTVWNAIQAFMLAAWDGFKSVVETVFTAILDFFINTWTAIRDFKQSIIDAIVNFITEKFNAIKDFISSILTGIKDFFTTAWTTIKDFVLNTLASLKDGVVAKATAIKTAIVDGITAAVDWIKELPGKALEWGKSMIQGFINGIKAMAGTILNAVKAIIPDVIEPYIGFGSPTEKGAGRNIVKWGQNMVKGFSEGIQSETANLKNTIDDAMGSSIGGMGGRGGGGVAASGGGGGAGTIVYVTVTGNNFMGTPQEFANQMNKSLQRRLQSTLKF